VDGDSLVFRARRAWGHLRTDAGPVALLFGAGLIPDLWINALEQHFHQRGAAPLLTERGQFFNHSDLGALALLNTWDDRLELALWVTNGEGRSEREQNTGKDLSLRLSVTPLRLPVHGAPLDVRAHGLYRQGSQGVGKARNDRVAAALTVGHTHYGLGAALYLADGYDGRSEQKARGLDLWADARLYPDWLGAMAHLTQLTVDPDDTAATTTRLSTGLFADLARPVPGLGRLRLYALYERDTVDAAAAPFPGIPEAANAQRVVLKLEASGAARFDF
ncbi:MAG: hypothetical protein KC613_28160, partial [Myxococcales bacterium]|nr:hypothetical protein [Myxococcales bacterium]